MTSLLREQKALGYRGQVSLVGETSFTLMVASRKLRSYFYVHPIEVLTNYPLHQVQQKLEASGRLLKWAIELRQFEVNFRPRTMIKVQALADFIAEFIYSNATEVTGTSNNTKAAKARGVKEE